jgi:peptidoglycan hydrolase-like protein with peptidoglycan-binding domain
MQGLAGNAATTVLVQRLVEDETAPYGGARESAGVEVRLPPPPLASGSEHQEPEHAPSAAGAQPSGAGTHQMLKRGSQGGEVPDLQARLNAAGAADPALDVDGAFGPLTDAAVRRYQETHDLVPDGIVGPLTWNALDGGGGGGGGEGPTPVTDPLAGICTIVGHGASAGAVDRARAQAIELYGSIAPANRKRMEADPVTIDVIPHAKKLTELPEYAHLAGTTTFDGRLWDNVRGIQTTVNGVRRVAVAEEDLVTVAGQAASYGSGFLEAHEGGHGLQASALTSAQVTQLATMYAARLTASGPITQTTPAGTATAMWLSPSWYSAANKEEYFANSVAAYHGHPYTNGAADVAIYTRSWLQTNDPPMFALLQAVYQHGGTP